MKYLNHSLLVLICATLFLGSCSKGGGFNLFSIEDDKALGAQFDAELEANDSINILARVEHPEAYRYLDDMRDVILNSGEVQYKDEFVWELHIIHDDNTLNAFATPGGYIYIYTGLIHFLDSASSLAGVLGHEIAHSDNRHSTGQMTKQYGIATLLQVALGNDPNLLAEITAGLLSLRNSRSDETDADNSSVRYLCNTQYKASGAADFFQKIVDSGSQSPPQFLSTHPNPDNRVENIKEMADAGNCQNAMNPDNDGYAAFKALLP